jgi:hypothetical protein
MAEAVGSIGLLLLLLLVLLLLLLLVLLLLLPAVSCVIEVEVCMSLLIGSIGRRRLDRSI